MIPVDLSLMAKQIAEAGSEKGCVIVTMSGEGAFRVGGHGLTAAEAQAAFCVGIHHNLLLATHAGALQADEREGRGRTDLQ